MSTVNKKEQLIETYDTVLITGVSMVAKKVAGTPLNTPAILKGAAKVALAVGPSLMLVKYSQEKK